MNRTIKAAVALTAVATALVVAMSQRPGDTVAAAPLAAASEHSGHRTATEQIARMAAAGDIHAGHAMEEMTWAALQAAPGNASLPADDMGAQARLAGSPRTGEFVKIDVGGTSMTAWVVHPQGQARAPVVVVIQEVFGLSDWIRGVADQLAAEGFIAVAPDLLSGHGPNGGDSPAFANQQEMVKATLLLPAPELTTRIKAARGWGLKLPQANGKSASVGFCFGGSQSFALAVTEPALNAAVVYYGAAPVTTLPASPGETSAPFLPSDALANIKAPVLGLYGGMMQDARIGSTIPPTEAKMKALGKTFEPHVFDGAAHGFLRAQTGNAGANMRASQQAWPMTVAWLKKYAS